MAAIPALRPGHMIPLLRVRCDALPENFEYQDDGCEVAPACLSCPLERCRYDEFHGLHMARLRARNPQVVALRRDGALIREIMAQFRLSRRQVYRVLAQA